MIQLDSHELAWAAGFFDGEGTISRARISHHRTGPNGNLTNPLMGLGQSCREPLERFLVAVNGLGGVYGPYRATNGNKPRFVWQTTKFEHSQAVVALLWRYLSEPKCAQIALALKEYYDLRKRRAQARKTLLPLL